MIFPNLEIIKGGKLDLGRAKRILLIQLGDIGDVILTYPCIRALKETLKSTVVFVAVHDKAKGLIEECPWADGVIPIKKDKQRWIKEVISQIAFIRNLRRKKFDLVFDLRTGDRSAILSLLSAASQKASFYGIYNKLWRNRIYTHLVLPDRTKTVHIVDYYSSLLATYGIFPSKINPEYRVSSIYQKKADTLLEAHGVRANRPIVVLQPFSLWAYKELALQKIAEIAKWIVTTYNAQVILTGTHDQKQRAEAIVQQSGVNVTNLAGKTSLKTLAAVIARCVLSIGVDSAGTHIAAAVGVPTLTIFGPGDFREWTPRGNDHRVIHKDLDCIPCKRKGCNGSERSKCLDELTVEEVITQMIPAFENVVS